MFSSRTAAASAAGQLTIPVGPASTSKKATRLERLSKSTLLLRIVPDNSSAHYLRGQILERLGRTEEAKAEMKQANEISNSARAKRQQELEAGVQDPQLMEQTTP